jgi:hypothetical protein
MGRSHEGATSESSVIPHVLREKYEDGFFVKMKAQLVADGRNIYNDYSSPTAKTKLVMTCLKLAAVKKLRNVEAGCWWCLPMCQYG